MTHMAMSSIRVMATCTLLGEAVGKACSIAVKNSCTPHDVYLDNTPLLQKLLMNEDCFLPSKTRVISENCKNAALNIKNDIIRNGQDRGHEIYGNDSDSCTYLSTPNEEIVYSFEKQNISSVHIVFCSDLNRETLGVSTCEKDHSMRANQMLSSPQMKMPKTLCKEFILLGELDGKKTEILNVSDNRKRSYHIEINQTFDKLILIPISTWRNNEIIPIISFDFE